MTRAKQRFLPRCLGIAVLLSAGVTAAVAEDVADFYKGKTFTIVVGHEVGTGFDIYSRVLARHIGRHIPGSPSVVVQNMVGASGLAPANWLYNAAPKDGSVIMTFVHTAALEPIFGNPAARFEPTKFTWVGNMDEGVGICGVSKASGIAKLDDLLAQETVFGATGATGPLAKYALAVKNLLGAKIKLVPGYKGSASVKLAINRGEVQGICGLSMSSVTSQWRDELQSGAFKPILQLSGKPHPALRGVPHVDSYAKTAQDKQVFGLIFGVQALGRIYASTPGLPPERASALRTAFTATMSDPQFLDDAAKSKIDISPDTGAEVDAFIGRIAASSPEVVERVRRATKQD
jgi:tripartite-type tricarboxylate transporter receptor subunit TctC